MLRKNPTTGHWHDHADATFPIFPPIPNGRKRQIQPLAALSPGDQYENAAGTVFTIESVTVTLEGQAIVVAHS